MSSSRLSFDWPETAQLFEDSTEDKRRSVLFSIAVVTGFISTTATSAVVASGQHVPTILVMSLLAGLSFVFAGFVYAGGFESLVSDEELLWQLFDE
jgi:hypothetical protein